MSLIAGLIVGINIAAGANVPGLGPLDHYLCYNASVAPATTTPGVQFPLKKNYALLVNQFETPIGRVGSLVMNCNPVAKTVPGVAGAPATTTQITKPNDHLACWSFDAQSKHPSQVLVANQFSPTDAAGNAVPVPLNVIGLRQLCLPSFKSLPGGNLLTGAPDDLDHYSCYAVAYPPAVSGSKPIRFVPPLPPPKTTGVQLEDEFTDATGITAPGITVAVGAPQLLCLPTIKIIQLTSGQGVPNLDQLIDGTDHLLCFGVRTVVPATGFVPPAQVFDSNQFGIGTVNIHAMRALCVPSLKQVPTPPPTTTSTTTCPAAITCTTTTTTTIPCPSGPCQVQPPVVTKVFGTTQIPAGGSTSLTFTITNPNPTSSLTGLTFADPLPPPMIVATPSGLVSSCNPAGSVVAPDGAPTINVNGVTLGPGKTCSFTVIVTVPSGGPGGVLNNQTSPITTNEAAPGNPATASIDVG
jgi:hypothetical protein